MQKVMLIGNLGRDPEVKYSQHGTLIAQCERDPPLFAGILAISQPLPVAENSLNRYLT